MFDPCVCRARNSAIKSTRSQVKKMWRTLYPELTLQEFSPNVSLSNIAKWCLTSGSHTCYWLNFCVRLPRGQHKSDWCVRLVVSAAANERHWNHYKPCPPWWTTIQADTSMFHCKNISVYICYHPVLSPLFYSFSSLFFASNRSRKNNWAACFLSLLAHFLCEKTFFSTLRIPILRRETAVFFLATCLVM